MEYSGIVKRILRDHKSLSYAEIETALVRAILNTTGIRKVKNRMVNHILKSESIRTEMLVQWLACNGVQTDLRLLEKYYELNIQSKERKINGAYYTPEHIVEFIVHETFANKIGTVCDPACGSGAFLAEAARYIRARSSIGFKEIYAKMLFGIDILSSNKKHTETILSLLAVISGEDRPDFIFNIVTGNSLDHRWASRIKNFAGFDFIVGNPPYVRAKNLDMDVRKSFSNWETGNFGNPDLYIPFFELGLKYANPGGRVGFITPSTYLTSVNARRARGMLASSGFVEKIVDFNGWQIFKGATTYTCITILSRVRSEKILFTLVDRQEKIHALGNLEYAHIDLSDFGEKEWRLLSKKDAENIFNIEHVGSPLFRYVNRFVTGIATLNNDLFLVKDNGQSLLEKEYGGRIYLIEREFTKNIIKPNRVKDLKALSANKERVIYPYRLVDGKAKVMNEAEIAKLFPFAYRYLLAAKDQLALRDKGKRDYCEWYAYGRSQGVSDFGKKIILPMMGNRATFIVVEDPNNLIYCGYAIFAKQDDDYRLLEKVLNSDVMWYYIKKTSKNYSGGFKSFAKNYVKNFSIPAFTEAEKKKLLSIKDHEQVNSYLWQKYQLTR